MTSPAPLNAVSDTHVDNVRGSFAVAGVRQFGDPVLRRKCKPIRLSREHALAGVVIDCLLETIRAARELHDFSRGIGLAAPQIGIPRRIAIVQPAGELPIRLVNPRVVRRSPDEDVQFEGCLSFFDFRGEVRRPTAITVEYEGPRGGLRRVDLIGDAARLALHEIDHLDGVLYLDRMTPAERLVKDDGTLP